MSVNTITRNARCRAIALISLFAGCGDLLSGVLLVIFPLHTLGLMGAPSVKEPALIQFIGVFVACVGASYFLGLLSWMRTGSQSRLRVVWELTILFRIAAGGFVAWQIGAGHFSWAWASVPATDFTWALVQASFLRQGAFESEL